jgi:hypothetical protein
VEPEPKEPQLFALAEPEPQQECIRSGPEPDLDPEENSKKVPKIKMRGQGLDPDP